MKREACVDHAPHVGSNSINSTFWVLHASIIQNFVKMEVYLKYNIQEFVIGLLELKFQLLKV